MLEPLGGKISGEVKKFVAVIHDSRALKVLLPWGLLLMKMTQIDKQEAQGPWHSAWTEDPVHKNVLKIFT